VSSSPITFVVLGKPATAGNKRGIPFMKKGGGLGVHMIEGRNKNSEEHSRAWRSFVRDAARTSYAGEPLSGPLCLKLVFAVPRPAGHFGASGLLNKKGRENPYPVVRPDVTKWVRAFEDSLKGVTWHDDSQIVRLYSEKVYGDHFATRAEITRLTP